MPGDQVVGVIAHRVHRLLLFLALPFSPSGAPLGVGAVALPAEQILAKQVHAESVIKDQPGGAFIYSLGEAHDRLLMGWGDACLTIDPGAGVDRSLTRFPSVHGAAPPLGSATEIWQVLAHFVPLLVCELLALIMTPTVKVPPPTEYVPEL